MRRLIDAEALPTSIENMDLEVAEKIVERWMQDAPCDISWDAVRVLRDFYDEVKDAPTIDAVEVVRCKDCKYLKLTGGRESTGEGIYTCDVWKRRAFKGNGFCSYAESRGEQ